jgi:hypothetical protein
VGGTAAALAASSYGLSIVLTEEYQWIGGQLTSQGVPPDEHPWIEDLGCTVLYRRFRNKVRQYYEAHYPVPGRLVGTPFNPGNGFVSALCHEPRIAHEVIDSMLAPYIDDLTLIVKLGRVPIAADMTNEMVQSVHFLNIRTGDVEIITANYVIDCTELGDLLPLTGADYVSGAESQTDTGELHAPSTADPNDVQGFTWCFAAGYDPAGTHIIDRPKRYDFWREYCPQLTDSPWPGNLLNWTAVNPITLAPRKFDLFMQETQPYNSLWNYRKIVDPANLGIGGDEISLINWPQNDYFLQNIIDQPAGIVSAALEDAKQLSLSLLYWMQTEAPRPDADFGYPGLYLAPGALGTDDGLAMAPYIRESRRIKARFTVTEAHVGSEMRQMAGLKRAQVFEDTVGIGCYRIDLHPTPAGKNYIDISSLPFQIPLGALIPVQLTNLIAGNKNVGVTHITNGCYRLHPVEWNIGESAAHLAAFCHFRKIGPHSVHENKEMLTEYQQRLANAGVELSWPDEIAELAR